MIIWPLDYRFEHSGARSRTLNVSGTNGCWWCGFESKIIQPTQAWVDIPIPDFTTWIVGTCEFHLLTHPWENNWNKP